MRVLVTGASGNVGSALLRRLGDEDGVAQVRALCRRPPPEGAGPPFDDVTWFAGDLSEPAVDDVLRRAVDGVDAVVHLAWRIQPSHDEDAMWRTNVDGTRRVLTAVGAAGVPHLVHLSSLGAYSPGPQDEAVPEEWPTDGIPTSTYSRQKAAAERVLDEASDVAPGTTVTRVRPGLVMQREAGSEIARYFLGHLLPSAWVGRVPLPLLPLPQGLRGQVVHADDLADALWRILERRPAGAFNVAAEPQVGARDIARALRAARFLPVPWAPVRVAAALTWWLRIQPTDAGWLDLARHVPRMSTRRARDDLGWQPAVPGPRALEDLVAGMGAGAGMPTPPMTPRQGW